MVIMGKIKEQVCIDQDLYLVLVKIQENEKISNMSQTLNYFLRYAINKIGDVETIKLGYQHTIDRLKDKIRNLELEGRKK